MELMIVCFYFIFITVGSDCVVQFCNFITRVFRITL